MLLSFTSALLLSAVMARGSTPEKVELRHESPDITRARARAVTYLVEQLGGGQVKEYRGQEGGVPALVVLALWKSGVKPDDARLGKSLDDIKALKPKTTYVVSLQLRVLCAAHVVGGCPGVLASNSFARDVAGKLVKVQSDLETLLPGHRPVTFDLTLESCFRSHGDRTLRSCYLATHESKTRTCFQFALFSSMNFRCRGAC